MIKMRIHLIIFNLFPTAIFWQRDLFTQNQHYPARMTRHKSGRELKLEMPPSCEKAIIQFTSATLIQSVNHRGEIMNQSQAIETPYCTEGSSHE